MYFKTELIVRLLVLFSLRIYLSSSDDISLSIPHKPEFCENEVCEMCVELEECFWCSGQIRISTGSVVWGYCGLGTSSFARFCNLDGGDTITGNDTSLCHKNLNQTNQTLTSSQTISNRCPYNTCNMCSKAENCSWCDSLGSNSWSCIDQSEVSPNTKCDSYCADAPPSPCEALDCPSCSGGYVSNSFNSSETAFTNGSYKCSWCAGQYQSTLGILYPWGFCLPDLSTSYESPCTMEKGKITNGCSFPSTSSYTVNIDMAEASLRRMADPFEDPCTQNSFCFNCLATSGCGWCSSTWGECRSISRTKNGEYGEQFCSRELAFWHEIDCYPTLSEISEKLKSIPVSSFQATLDTLKENIAELTVIQVVFNNATTPNEVNVLLFQRVLSVNFSKPGLLDQQCTIMMTLIREKIPQYLVKKNLDCVGIPLMDNRILSELSIKENTTYNASTRPVWSILFFLVIWFL